MKKEKQAIIPLETPVLAPVIDIKLEKIKKTMLSQPDFVLAYVQVLATVLDNEINFQHLLKIGWTMPAIASLSQACNHFAAKGQLTKVSSEIYRIK